MAYIYFLQGLSFNPFSTTPSANFMALLQSKDYSIWNNATSQNWDIKLDSIGSGGAQYVRFKAELWFTGGSGLTPPSGQLFGVGLYTATGQPPIAGFAFSSPIAPTIAQLIANPSLLVAEADYFAGSGGADTFYSGAEADELHGGWGNDYLNGGTGNDVILGEAGNDQLFGDVGNDVLSGGDGADVIDGGAGVDLISYADASARVVADLGLTVAQNTGGGGSDKFISIENLKGSGYNDVLKGSAAANTLYGFNGADLITGLGGNDLLNGDAGDDTLDGGAGDDVIDGGDGLDSVSYASATAGVTVDLALSVQQNTIGAGRDRIVGIERLFGSAFGDTLKGNALANVLRGDAGNDIVYGGDGADDIRGGVGADALSGDDGADTIYGEDHNDTINGGAGADILRGDAGADSINGGADNDNIGGGAGNDTLNGAEGNDVLYADDGNDVIDGGADQDTLSYINAAAGVTVNLSITTAQNTGGAGIDTISNIESLIGSNFDDTLTASNDGDVLRGGAGNDQLDGGQGDDLLLGGAGADTLDGGDGLDTVNYSDAAAGVTVDLAIATQQNTGGGGLDTLMDIERVTGSAFSDVLRGNAGDNLLTGAQGNDQLDGRTGDDTMVGGDGDDTYWVDSAADVVTEAFGGGQDKIYSAISYSLAGTYVEVLELTGSLALNADGSADADTLIGNDGDNVLTGLGGADSLNGGLGIDTLYGGDNADTLDGGIGADSMEGGAGNDVYYVDDVGDQIVEVGGTDTVRTTISYVLTADLEYLQLLGSADLDATGNAGANYIQGNAGANVIDGADGADSLWGYAGADTLVGGLGNDLLVAGEGDDSLTGGDGNDTLYGQEGADQLYGGIGNDTLEGDEGADTMSGGDGDDFYFADGADLIVENPNEGIDTIRFLGLTPSPLSFLLPDNVENVNGYWTSSNNITGNALNNNIGGGTLNDTLIGGDGDDELNGGGDDDVLNGGDGDDSLSGSGGADVLNGGAGLDDMYGGDGDDLYYVDDVGDDILESGGSGIDTVASSISWALTDDFWEEIENLTLIGAASIDATGNALNNVLTGNGGDNILNGGAGVDTASYSNATVGVNVSLVRSGPQDLGAWGADTLISIENLIGSAYADVLAGDGGANMLDGRAGADRLSGGSGDDLYIVDNAGDVVLESVNAGTDRVQSSVSWVLTTTVENLTLTGSAAINGTGNAGVNQIIGNAGANSLLGNAGNDYLSGAAGNDFLYGGVGADTILGGAGRDAFVLNTGIGAGQVDRFSDFAVLDDTVWLENAIFAKIGSVGALNAAFFRVGASAADANDYVIYNKTTGALLYDADGNAAGGAVQIATLSANLALTSADFLVI